MSPLDWPAGGFLRVAGEPLDHSSIGSAKVMS